MSVVEILNMNSIGDLLVDEICQEKQEDRRRS
jgi:hypothetical protein